MSKGRLGGGAYVAALVALLVLTLLSYIAAAHLPLGPLDTVVALGVAVVKGMVVMLIFMHLWESRPVTQIAVLVWVLFIVILCLGIVSDVAAR